jgi:hypothetical protein
VNIASRYKYESSKKGTDKCHGRVYLFLFFCVKVLIIRYDKMVSHMMPTCALYSSPRACDPEKDLPYQLLDMCTL